jgi:adhesin transport system outer membrane protein
MELHRLNVQARQDIVAFIKERADLGGSAASDVLRARARQTEAEAALSAASVREQAAESAWREVFQSEPPSKVEVWPDFALNVGALKEQIDVLVALFPTVQEAKQLSLASEKDAAAARANLFPRVALEHSIAQNKQTSSGTEYTDRSTLVTLRYNFLSGGAEMARARQAASKAVEYAMQAETEQRNTEKNLRQTLSEVALGQEILRNRRLAVGVANDTLAAVREQFAFRRGSLLDLLRAQEDVFMAGRDLIDAVTDHALARYRLLYMASMLEEHFSLGTPP